MLIEKHIRTRLCSKQDKDRRIIHYGQTSYVAELGQREMRRNVLNNKEISDCLCPIKDID